MPCNRNPSLLLMALSLLVGACAQDSAYLRWDPLTQPEQEMRARVQALKDIVWEGTTLTAIGGALAGTAIGGVPGAARGAQIGRLAGAAAGRYVADQKRRHDEHTAVLRAVIADLEDVNGKTQALLVSMRSVVEQQRAVLGKLETQVQMNQKEQQAAKGARSRARKNLDVMQDGVRAAKAHRELFGESQRLLEVEDPEAITPMDDEIARFTHRIANMEALVRDLSEAI